MVMEISKLLLPLMTWVVVTYGLSSIRNGECKIKLSFVSIAYCMLPFVIFTIPLSLLSNILSGKEAGIFFGIQMLIDLWMAFLFYKQVMETNNYSFFETVELIILSIFAAVIVWAVFLTVYIFTMNVWNFLSEIILDVRTLMS